MYQIGIYYSDIEVDTYNGDAWQESVQLTSRRGAYRSAALI